MTAKILEFKPKLRAPQETFDPRWQTATDYLSERQYGEALEVLEDLAEDGFVGAYYPIGVAYETGRGVERPDMETARYWYMRAIDAIDDGNGYFGMASLALNGYKDAGSHSDAIDYLWKACDKDNPRALIFLGWLYQMGEGVEKDFTQAAELYERAIAHDYVVPILHLSRLRFQEGRYFSGVWLDLKARWRAMRIAMEDVEDERMWNYLSEDDVARYKNRLSGNTRDD